MKNGKYIYKLKEQTSTSTTFVYTLSEKEAADLEIMWDYPIRFNMEVDEGLIPENAQRVTISENGEIIVIK